jgi:hypothetical protein
VVLRVSQWNELDVPTTEVKYIDPYEHYLSCVALTAMAIKSYVYLLVGFTSPKSVYIAHLMEGAGGVYSITMYDASIVGDTGFVNYAMAYNSALYFVGDTYELMGTTLMSTYVR